MAFYTNINLTDAVEPTAAVVTNISGAHSVDSDLSGSWIVTNGISASVTITLPADPQIGFFVGVFHAHAIGTYTVTVATAGSDTMYDTDDGTGAGNFVSTVSSTAGQSGSFYYIGNNKWIEHTYGTWTFST